MFGVPISHHRTALSAALSLAGYINAILLHLSEGEMDIYERVGVAALYVETTRGLERPSVR